MELRRKVSILIDFFRITSKPGALSFNGNFERMETLLGILGMQLINFFFELPGKLYRGIHHVLIFPFL